MEPEYIDIKNARVHNLQSVSLRLPRNQLICFTGVSGSGKSSLAFDTLYAEGQRRYIESLSSYARQFMKPGRKKKWEPLTLTLLVGQLQKLIPNAKVDWNRKVFVEINDAGGNRFCKIITHQPQSLRVDFHTPPGRITPAQVEKLGFEQQFERPGTSGAAFSIWLRDMKEIDTAELRTVVKIAVSG